MTKRHSTESGDPQRKFIFALEGDRYVVGRLCVAGHDIGGGQSIRYRANRGCVECRRLLVERLREPLTRAESEMEAAKRAARSAHPFDREKFVLGNPCKRGHRYHGSDFTLRRVGGYNCVECQAVQCLAHSRRSDSKAKRAAYKRTQKARMLAKRYKQSDKGKASDRRFQLSQRYRDQQRIYQHKRRATRRAAQHVKYSMEEQKRRFAEFDNACAYCESTNDVTIDHFIPLVRGGCDCLSNIVPACRRCNCSKNRALPGEWYPAQSFFRAERLARIRAVLEVTEH
jgi:5-methylcytosine-specific restriction endonuclease McrA